MKTKIIRNVLPILGVMSAPAMAGTNGGVDIAANMSVLFDLAGFIAGVIGVFLLAGGLHSLYAWSKGNQGKTPGAAALTMLIGTILASIGWFYQVIKGSFIGDNAEGVSISNSGQYSLALDKAALQAAQSVSGTGFGRFIPESTIKAVLAFVFLVGFIAFISGFFSLKDVGDNRGSQHPILSPIVKIVGGVICMNITWFSCILSGTLGIAALCSGS
jgi:hypothetical protein